MNFQGLPEVPGVLALGYGEIRVVVTSQALWVFNQENILHNCCLFPVNRALLYVRSEVVRDLEAHVGERFVYHNSERLIDPPV